MTIFGGGGMLGGPLAGWLTDRYGWPLSFWLQVGDVINKVVVLHVNTNVNKYLLTSSPSSPFAPSSSPFFYRSQ